MLPDRAPPGAEPKRTADPPCSCLFHSAEEADRETVERLVRDTGLNPVHLGPGRHDLLLKLWFTVGRGRHLAFKVR